MLAVELRPEERRGPFQDFIGTLELSVLLFECFHAGLLVGRDSGFDSVIDVSLAHPRSYRLDPVAELFCDARSRSLGRAELRAESTHHPDCCRDCQINGV